MPEKKQSIKNKRYIVALAIIFNEKGQVLLSKRHEPKSPLHDLWQFPGGGVEFREHPKDTVLREIKEEINLEIQIISPHPFVYQHQFTPTHEVILFAYPAKYISGQIDTSGDPDTAEAKWFNPEEINFSQTTNLTKEALTEVLNTKDY